jgi:predicted ATPase
MSASAPTIARIKRHFAVVHFDGAHDYRFSAEAAERPRFFAPLDAATEEHVRRIFVQYESEAALGPKTLSAAGHPLTARGAGTSLRHPSPERCRLLCCWTLRPRRQPPQYAALLRPPQ